MKRLPDWETRLIKFVEGDIFYNWQTMNCALFAGFIVGELTGLNFTKEYLSELKKISSERRMFRYLRSIGGVESIADKHLGKRKPVSQAQRGDVVSCNLDLGLSLGICVGGMSVFISRDGKVFVETDQCKNAWSVG